MKKNTKTKETKMPVYKTLDQLKEEFKKTYLADKVIYQKDVMDALEHLDLTDNDMDDLYEWFAAEGIDISEDDDIEELENIEIPEAGAMTQDIGDDLEFLAEDAGEDFDEEVEDVEVPIDLSETYSSSPYVRINDPVKMYLKEIGRVPLLNPEDEPEIARRIQAGDEEAKRILISSNLRLVCLLYTSGSFRRQTTADRRKYAGDGRTDAGTEDKRHRRIQGHRPGFI